MHGWLKSEKTTNQIDAEEIIKEISWTIYFKNNFHIFDIFFQIMNNLSV